MKKFLLVATLLLAVSSLSHAAPVDATTARAAATSFLTATSKRGPTSAVTLAHAEMNTHAPGTAAYYIFNGGDRFVIVAGDDRAREILAHGNGNINDLESLPENMKFWLGYYRTQMEFLQSHPGLVVQQPSLNDGVSVAPLLTATWDQGYPYYSQCPMDGDRRSLTGCAATSLAQIFYMWQYPTGSTPVVPGYTTRTRGFVQEALPSIRFDWENMLDAYQVGYYNDNNKNAVAQLMHYIGQAEQMDYTNEGSEAFEDDILRACYMFGYAGASVTYKSFVDFDNVSETPILSDEEWSALLQSELVAGRPMVLCAYDYSSVYNMYYGHAFDIDGYDASDGTFHINWGWSGTGNGYFALNAFSYQGTNYHIGQLIVMGIEPPAPIESYDPVLLPADSAHITLTSFRADWTDETPDANVTSYTLEVTAGAASEPGVYEKVFTESFPYASENGSRPLSKIDNYCTNKGWTGSNVYEARGGLRLGGGGSAGVLTTPAVDMTQSGGKMTVVITLKPYQSADSNVPVTLSCGNSVESVTVNSESTYSIVLSCDADAEQKVTITGGDGSNTKRVTVTQIDIYSATADAAKRLFGVPVESGDSTSRVITGITDKYYTVTGLTAGGTFNYRVKAYYVNGTESAWSNVEEVTLFDGGHAFEPGDVNHDGVVGIEDVTTLIDYLLGNTTDVCLTCADVSGDGLIGIADVTGVIDILLNNTAAYLIGGHAMARP